MFGAEVTEVYQLTDDTSKVNLESFAVRTKAVSAKEALANVKKNVRLDASKLSARLRIKTLSHSYLELCNKRGWKFVEMAPKAAIKHIIFVL